MLRVRSSTRPDTRSTSDWVEPVVGVHRVRGPGQDREEGEEQAVQGRDRQELQETPRDSDETLPSVGLIQTNTLKRLLHISIM